MNIKKEIIKTYNKIAEIYDKEFCKKIYFIEDLKFFLSKLPKKAKIIDVGCGTGHIAKYCEDKGCRILGTDLSEKMLKIARKRCKRSKFIKADVEKFRYGKENYDGIIALFILIHLKDFEKILKKWNNALKPNGLLFLSVIKGKGQYFGPEPFAPKLKMYFKYTTKKEIQEILKKVGFKIVRFKERLLEIEHEKQKEFFIIARKTE